MKQEAMVQLIVLRFGQILTASQDKISSSHTCIDSYKKLNFLMRKSKTKMRTNLRINKLGANDMLIFQFNNVASK